MSKCFNSICEATLENCKIEYKIQNRIKKQEVKVELPVRVNFGGGWSDTPPYCLENGGTVLNVPVMLESRKPIIAEIKRIDENKIILESADIGAYTEFTDILGLQNCSDTNDAFALHKAALISCGIIPKEEKISVEEICKNLGGGLRFSTQVINIPKGSGLGTSSILSAACVKAIYEFLGEDVSNSELYSRVMCMEQLMSTGGGWQDQVGGLTPGVKLISTVPGFEQNINLKTIAIPEDAKKSLQERFCLIYTGQRRLARNLLREIVGKYIGNDTNAIEVLYKIQQYAVLMKAELEKGNIEEFCKLLNGHWELSKRLDSGCTNTCINQIFDSIDDLIEGRMICGAGGGGFLQVILKSGVTIEMLRDRLWEVFADSGVQVYSTQFCFE
ncbi:MAG: fucokinase [Clostridia bacterium]|nr:fucokinase [Clostridia bacterium]